MHVLANGGHDTYAFICLPGWQQHSTPCIDMQLVSAFRARTNSTCCSFWRGHSHCRWHSELGNRHCSTRSPTRPSVCSIRHSTRSPSSGRQIHKWPIARIRSPIQHSRPQLWQHANACNQSEKGYILNRLQDECHFLKAHEAQHLHRVCSALHE